MSVFRSEFVVFLLQSGSLVPEEGGRDRIMDEKSLDHYFKGNGDPW